MRRGQLMATTGKLFRPMRRAAVAILALAAGVAAPVDLEAAIELAHDAKTALKRTLPERIAQATPEAEVAPVQRERPSDTPPSTPGPIIRIGDDGIWNSVQDWLARANREYQGTVIRELSLPPSGTDDAIAKKLEEERAAEAARKAEEAQRKRAEELGKAVSETPVPPAPSVGSADPEEDLKREREKLETEAAKIEADRKAAEERRLAEEASRLEAQRKADEEKRLAEAKAKEEADKKAVEARAKAEAEKKAAEERRIAAERAEAERKAAEAKRLADEKAKADADKKAAEDKRLAEQRAKEESERQAAEQKRLADEKAKAEADRAAAEQKAAEQKAAEDKRRAEEAEAKATAERLDAAEAQPKATEQPVAQATPPPAAAPSGAVPRPDAVERPDARVQPAACPNAGARIRPPGRYVVNSGDSLWMISRRHYKLGRLYPRIYGANRRKIRNPDLIYPCQRLVVPKKATKGKAWKKKKRLKKHKRRR